MSQRTSQHLHVQNPELPRLRRDECIDWQRFLDENAFGSATTIVGLNDCRNTHLSSLSSSVHQTIHQQSNNQSSLQYHTIQRPHTPPPLTLRPPIPLTPSRPINYACKACHQAHRECIHIRDQNGATISCQRCVKRNIVCERVPRTPRTSRRTPGRSTARQTSYSDRTPQTPTRRQHRVLSLTQRTGEAVAQRAGVWATTGARR